jgi:hypothetical protein
MVCNWLRRSEGRQREDAALTLARTRQRHIDRITVCRGGAVEACIVQRAVVDRDSADRYIVSAPTECVNGKN